MQKSEKTTLIATILLVGFFICVVTYYILGFYAHMSFPYNTSLFDPIFAFTDFSVPIAFSKNLAPFFKTHPMINYFPLAYILLFPATLLKNNLLAFYIFISFFLLSFSFLNFKALKCENLTFTQNFQNIFIFTFLSFPFLLLVDRGNLDMFLLLFFALFVYLFKKEKYILAAITLALINSIKPFMIAFLFLFLFKKNFKEFFLNIIMMLFLVIGGFWVLKGDFFNNISIFIYNVKLLNEYLFSSNQDSSIFLGSTNLFLALKFFFLKLGLSSIDFSKQLAFIYNIISLIINVIVLFFVYKEKLFWKQINLLVLPYVVNDYKLIFLFVPIWLFVNSKQTSPFDRIYCWLFGLLLIAKKFIILPFFGFCHLAIFANPLLIMIFIALLIYEQFYLKKKEV